MKILVVDDDPVSRRVLRQVITAAEPESDVAEVACGIDACMLLEKPGHGFNAVFLDISMPGLDGLALLQRFQKNPALRAVPFVLCTSSNDRPTVIRAAAAGARHYIVKPPAAAVVAEKLKMVRAGMKSPAVAPAVGATASTAPFASAAVVAATASAAPEIPTPELAATAGAAV